MARRPRVIVETRKPVKRTGTGTVTVVGRGGKEQRVKVQRTPPNPARGMGKPSGGLSSSKINRSKLTKTGSTMTTSPNAPAPKLPGKAKKVIGKAMKKAVKNVTGKRKTKKVTTSNTVTSRNTGGGRDPQDSNT